MYYIPPAPSPTPEANVAKTDNDSMKGGRIGLLGQTISIFIFSELSPFSGWSGNNDTYLGSHKENSMVSGDWHATVCGVAKSWK